MQKIFIGVDISKETLAVCVKSGFETVRESTVDNSPSAIRSAMKRIMKEFDACQDGMMVCAEYTGRYIYPLASACSEMMIFLWLEDPSRLKLSMGLTRGKNDRVDARRIAEYCCRFSDKAIRYEMRNRTLESLKNLLADRALVLGDIKKYRAQLRDQKGFMNKEDYSRKKKSWEKIIRVLQKELAEIDSRMEAISAGDETVRHQRDLLESVDGVGPKIALNMIVITDCFTSFPDARKFCIYAGLVPFSYDSGTSIRSRSHVSKRANQQIKALLHMSAVNVSTKMKGSEYKEYFDRKVAEGKHKLSVLNVVRAKIVERMFAVIRDDRKYERQYRYEVTA